MSAMHNERNPHTVLIPIGALASGATANVVGPKLPRNAKILSASLIDTVAIAASGSNYVTATLKQAGDGDTLASGHTQSGLTAFVGKDLTVSDGSADRGETLKVTVVSTGSAVLTNAALSVVLHY